jgi:hypothetical protein
VNFHRFKSSCRLPQQLQNISDPEVFPITQIIRKDNQLQ